MCARAIGDVRPSQIITTFGPGAVVDLQTLSIIVAGIDDWQTDSDHPIREPRLERALHVKRFFPAKPTEGSHFYKQGTVPAYLFPRYQVCPVCQTLSAIGEGDTEYDERFQEIRCKATGCSGRGRHQAATIPAPFIVACQSGHINDFPWREYVHKGSTICRKRLKLYSTARTGAVADITISCECGISRSAGEAFGEQRGNAIGECSRHRPWLGPNSYDTASCPHSKEVRAMQRGATNAWFPVVRSALAIKEDATPIGIALNACNPQQIAVINSPDTLQMLIQSRIFSSLEGFSIEDIWTSIQKQRGEIETDDIDLRWPEWLALRHADSTTRDQGELFLQSGKVPVNYSDLVDRVVLVRKLLEVRALVGFTRIDPSVMSTDDSIGSVMAPIYSERQDWLPAIEVRGEGLFIELNESAVTNWETGLDVRRRAETMAKKFNQWQSETGGIISPFPGARYVLLHSLAHALIRQLSLDCGYSASSVRERIYSCTDPKRKMAGILLYTASPDSEGSLGGLVDLGSPTRLPDLFANALSSCMRCSSDPLCADHQPEVHATINAAACHACILASETSCESFNRFLDRNFLVPTMAHSSLAYFHWVNSGGEGGDD